VVRRLKVFEGKRSSISRSKTECTEYERSSTVGGDRVSEVESSKDLGCFVQRNGRFDEDAKHGIQCGWIEWREASGVLCDNRIPTRQKGKRSVRV